MCIRDSRKGVDENVPVTQMKLQNLLFWGQGCYLAMNQGQRLFFEEFEKWEIGPICPTVYQMFQHVQDKPLTEPADTSLIVSEPSILNFLEWVWKSYGSYSALDLSSMIQSDPEWQSLPTFKPIPDEIIAQMFAKRLLA